MKKFLPIITLLAISITSRFAKAECEVCVAALNPQLMTEMSVSEESELRSTFTSVVNSDLATIKAESSKSTKSGKAAAKILGIIKVGGGGGTSSEQSSLDELRRRWNVAQKGDMESRYSFYYSLKMLPDTAWQTFLDCIKECFPNTSYGFRGWLTPRSPDLAVLHVFYRSTEGNIQANVRSVTTNGGTLISADGDRRPALRNGKSISEGGLDQQVKRFAGQMLEVTVVVQSGGKEYSRTWFLPPN